ncbi:pentatricopeptide repeat-containing protein At4g21065 [Selaginella moellendorffii]|nr:pentatricopeptide repeat-containing protein At4g21065 [Selaginella moellendorffii]|eukprot:XP_024526554.1 pentatricopeptide repeat-containing protein At4g21065 [Selaginella moellendorffii]
MFLVRIGLGERKGLRRRYFAALAETSRDLVEDSQASYARSLRHCRAQRSPPRQVRPPPDQSGRPPEKFPAGQSPPPNVWKCGDLSSAQEVFDSIPEKPRSPGPYSSPHMPRMGIPGLYDSMQSHGLFPSDFTISVALSSCSSLKSFERGARIHRWADEHGYGSNLLVQNALVNFYAKCSKIPEAMKLFGEMSERTSVTWNAVISAHAQNDRWHSRSLSRDAGRGCRADVAAWTEARAIFNGILERTVVSWSAMIGAYALHGRGQEALLLFHRMRKDGRVEPNAMTFTGVFNACGVVEDLEQGREIHALAMASGELKSSSPILENALLNMFVRCGSLEEARKVFDAMDHPDAFSWTNMITACTENCELLELASKSMPALMPAAFSAMQTRNSVSWTAMIAALAQHGQGDEALELFKEMNLEGMVADATTFICVLCACSHAGLIKESLEFFHSMVEDYAIAPTETHYCRALDTIGRAGRLQDAEELIHSMPFHPETVTWKTLLNSCRIHSQAERATKVAELLAKVAPEDSMAYTLLGNVYAATERYGDQMRVRKSMTDRGLKKVPGKSFIEVKNKVHEFVAGDRAHPSRDEILLELEKLGGRMREARYVPNTKDVLHAVNEEEKEQLIGLHSEKLAIAFGLIATPPGTPLLIVKNL